MAICIYLVPHLANSSIDNSKASHNIQWQVLDCCRFAAKDIRNSTVDHGRLQGSGFQRSSCVTQPGKRPFPGILQRWSHSQACLCHSSRFNRKSLMSTSVCRSCALQVPSNLVWAHLLGHVAIAASIQGDQGELLPHAMPAPPPLFPALPHGADQGTA